MFPKRTGRDIGKLTELEAVALWDFGLDILGLYEGLDGPGTCVHGLGVVGLRLLQALLVALLGKCVFFGNLGSIPNRFVSL